MVKSSSKVIELLMYEDNFVLLADTTSGGLVLELSPFRLSNHGRKVFQTAARVSECDFRCSLFIVWSRSDAFVLCAVYAVETRDSNAIDGN